MSDIRNLVNQMVSRYMGNSAQSPLTLPAVEKYSAADSSPYGQCPICGADGVSRERRLNGNDRCVNGHEYPSASAVTKDAYARKHKPATGQLGLFEKPSEKQKPLFSKKVDDEAGRWVTMRGARVFISGDDGRVLKGPKRLMGKTKEMIEKESASAGKGEGTEKPPMPKGLAEMGRIKGGRKDNRQKGLFEEINPGFRWDEDEDVKTVQPVQAVQQEPTPSPAVDTDPISALTDDVLHLRPGHRFEQLQRSLGVKKPAMGKKGTQNVQDALRKIKGGNVIAAMLATGSEHGNLVEFDSNGFPQIGNDAFQRAVDGKFSRDDLNAAKDFLESTYNNSTEFGNVNQYRWLAGVARVAKPKPESAAASEEPFSLTASPSKSPAKPATFNNTESTKQGALFDSGKGKGDLPGQELLFNSDAGDVGNPKTMENRVSQQDDSGPQDGDRDATGLVFRDGRWHRDDEGEGEGDKSSQSPAESGKKRGFTVERMNRATGKMEGVSFDIGEPVDVFLSNEKYTSGRLAHVSKDGQTVSVEFDGVRGKYRSKHHIGTIYKPGTLKGSDTSLKSIQKSTKPKYTLAKAVSDVNEKHGEGLTEADRVPGTAGKKEKGQFSDIDDHLKQLDKLKTAQAKADSNYKVGSSRARATTHAATQGNRAKQMTDIKNTVKNKLRAMLAAGDDVPQKYLDAVGSSIDYNEKGNYEPISKVDESPKPDEGPQEGDIDATGLVFRNGRWHRDDEEETVSADSSPSPAVDEPKSLEAKSEPEPHKPTSTYSGSFNPETHGDYKAFMDLKKKINAAELSVDEFKQAHKFYVDNKDAFTADLAKRYDAKTLRNIAGNLGDWRAIRGENKKGENADSVYSSMMQHAFDIGKGISNVYSGDEAREGLSKAALRRLADHVEKQTAESLAEHIADRAKSKAEWNEAQKANDEAAANPKTLSDFELTLKRAGGYDKLKPEQQALYDELMSEKTRSGREEEKRPTVVEAKVSGDHGGFELTKNFHSKRGQDIFTASPKNRVERDEYDKMNTAAKRLGGWYYKQFGSTPGGFHFPDEEKRNKFLQAMAGESVDRSDILAEKDQSKGEAKAEKLSDLAERMSERAKDSLGRDRKDNTARRARMADSAIASAEHELNQSARLKSIADSIEAGEAKHLKGLNSLTQLQALQSVWKQAQRQYEEHKLKEKYGDDWSRKADYREREATYQNSVAADSAAFAKMPRQIIYPSNVSGFLQKAAATPGLKQEAAKWQKIFSRNADPQDRDRGITLNKKSTEEWYEFANRAKSKGVKHDWGGFTGKDNFQRLAAMGIREDHELRSALRELAQHQDKKHGSAPVKDPVREFEKKVHREHKEAGFYPTPPKVVDRLMDLADIKDNHDVLEPSAGSGRIMDAIKAAHGDSVKLKGVEHHSTLNELLKMKGHDIDHGDFLEHKGSYDRIVMNPPFENDQAVDHVKHALSLLKPGGRIVAVIPGNERTYREASRNKRKEFAALVDQNGGHFEELPEGSFKGSDVDRETGVNTSIVVLHKPGAEKYSRLQMYEIARDVADRYVRESVEVVPVDRYAHPLIHAAVGGLGHMAVQSLVKNTTLRRIAHAAVASAMAAWMASANAGQTGQGQNPSTSPAVNQPAVSAPASLFARQQSGNRSIDAIVNQAFQNHQQAVAEAKAEKGIPADPGQSAPHSVSNTTGARAPGVKPLKGEDEPKSANPSTSPAGKGEGFTDNEHPRHPAGAPESKGGEFAPKGGVEGSVGESSSPSPRNYPDNLNKPADQQTNYSPPERSIEELAGDSGNDEPKPLEQKIAEHRMKLASQKSEPSPKASRRDDPDTSWKRAMNFGTERVQASKDAKSQERKTKKQQEQAVSFDPDQLEREAESSMADADSDASSFDSKPKPEDFKREKDYQRALKAWKREKGASKASITKKIAKSIVPEIATEYELDHAELESAVNDAIAMESEGHKRQEEARKYVTDRGYNAGRINRNEDAGKDHSSTSLDEVASEWAGLYPEIAGSDESQWVDRMWNLAKAGKQDAPSSGDEGFVRKVAARLHQQKMAGSPSFPADSGFDSEPDPGPIHGQVGDVDFTPFYRKSLAKELGLLVDKYLREHLVT